MKNQISDNDLENINDESSWEARKFQELLNEAYNEPLNADEKKLRKESTEEKPNHGVTVRRAIYHAVDIEKDMLGGGRVSILKNPEYFDVDIDALKKRLLEVTYWHSRQNAVVYGNEVHVKFAIDRLCVDYYVQINKHPTKEEPKTLEFLTTWGLF